MSKAARSIRIYALYIIVALGLPFLIAPGVPLQLVGMAAPDVWARVLGMSVLFLGAYFLRAAQDEATGLFKLSVLTRLSVPVFFGAFVALGKAPPVLMAFCAPDVAFALWTASALRSGQPQPARTAAAVR